jgi:hypothetical protein
VLNSAHYATVTEGIDDALDAAGWNREHESKGRFIFASSKGDTSVAIETRIELVKSIVGMTTANKYARATLYFAYSLSGKTAENCIELIKLVLSKLPKPVSQKRDKPLISMYLDYTDLVKASEVLEVAAPVLAERESRLVEIPALLTSSNHCSGLIAADVLAYLKSWDVLFPAASEAEQAELFESSVNTIHEDKLKAIRETLQLIKNVEVIVSE